MPGAHLSWADAAEIAFGLTSEVWHTAVEVFELIQLNRVKEPSQARGRTIESIRNRLITHSKKENGRFIWDQANHKFALRTKVESSKKKKLKRKTSTDGRQNKTAKKRKVDLSLLDFNPPPSSSTPKVPLLSPLGGCRTPIIYEGVVRHREYNRHGNMVYYEPLPLDAVVEDFCDNTFTVEVGVVNPSRERWGIVSSLNTFDLNKHHRMSPSPHKAIQSRRKYIRRAARPGPKPVFKFPPIQFNSDFFPEIAFHYFSKVEQSTSNNTNVYYHINAGDLRDCSNRSFSAVIPPEGVQVSESDSEDSEDDSTSSSGASAVVYNKTKHLLAKPKIFSQKATSKKEHIVKGHTMKKPIKSPSEVPGVKKAPVKRPSLHDKKPFQKKHPNVERNSLVVHGKNRRGVNARKGAHSRRSSSALSQRDVQHLLTTADSSLARVNLKGLLTIESFNKLPPDQRKTVAQFLPSMDQEGDRAGGVTAKSTAFSNVFFAASLREWQRSLSNSEFTVEYQTKVRAEERKRMIEAASQVNVKTPRLMFPSEPCHVPKPHNLSLLSVEDHTYTVITQSLRRLEEKDKPKITTPTTPNELLKTLKCNETINGQVSSRGSLVGSSTSQKKLRRQSRSEIEPKLPSRGRPKKQQDSPPPNGIVQRTAGKLSVSNLTTSPVKRPREYLSYVPPQVRYKEILIALEKAHKDNMSSDKSSPGKRRLSSEPLKRLMARHMKHRKISVYHDHFAILSPTLQPEDFRMEDCHFGSELTSAPDSPSTLHVKQDVPEELSWQHNQSAMLPKEENSCMCSMEALNMCKDCKYVYHSLCTTHCLICGSKLCY